MADESTVNQPGWQVRDVYNVVVQAADFAGADEARGYLRMLAALAAPVANAHGDGPPDGRALDVWGEWERLCEAARRTRDPVDGHGAPWAIVRLAPPTAEALRRALIPHAPGYQVLHFSCHAGAEGLTLEDALGHELLLPASELVEALRGTTVQLVVLNACATEAQAQALVEQAQIPCVIATLEPIDEREARVLSAQLYGDLAAGASVGDALEQARRTIAAQVRTGELPLAGDPLARAENLLLFGDATLRLAPGGAPARAPRFLPHPTPHNQPLPMDRLDHFVGRADELLKLARWFDRTGCRAFALSGVGGMGKTALALNAALRNAHRFGALAFASAKDAPIGPIQVLQALNEALGTTSSAEDAADPRAAIVRRLNGGAVLLLLDNLETLAPEQARELASALRGFDTHGGSRVLMTLRPLDQGELSKLADGRDRLDLTALDRADALRLAWIEAERQGVAPEGGQPLDAEDADVLERLMRRARLPGTMLRAEAAVLDELARLAFGHPALIKLAAAQVAEHGWAGARRRLERLQGKEIAEALDELIGQMLDDLLARASGAPELLHAALPFVGGADEGRLRYVALGRDVADEDDAAIDFADQLLVPAVRANLLTRGKDGRYDLDAPVRAYLERRRAPQPDLAAEHELRHAEAHAAVVAGYNKAINEGHMTYSAPLEWENVTAALERLAQRTRDERAARALLAYAWGWYGFITNIYDPRRLGWLGAARVAAERVGDDLIRARVLDDLGDVQQFQDEYDAALDSYEQATTLYRAVGAKLGEANVRKAIGDVQRFRKEMDAALASYQQALTLYQAIGDRLGEANVRRAIGDVQQFRKETNAALASYQQALTLYQAVGAKLGEANVRRAIGDVQQFRKETNAALASYQQALTLYQAVGEKLGEASTLAAWSRLLIDGDPAQSQALLDQAAALRQAIDDVYSMAVVSTTTAGRC